MNKMTVIQLLNKIANGEEVPKKVSYENTIYEFIEENRPFMIYVNRNNITICRYLMYMVDNLNDEVEIIEEDKKIPEKITINENGTIGFPNGQWTARNMDKAFAMKINSIIDYLKSKGE